MGGAKMKAFLFSLILSQILGGFCAGASITLAWDPNVQPPDGYKVFQRENGQAYAYDSPAWTGGTTSATISNLIIGKTYFFVVRAFVGQNESGDSNEVRYTPTESIPAPNLDIKTADLKAQLDRIEGLILEILNRAPSPTPSPTAFILCGNPQSMKFHKSTHWCGSDAVTFSTDEEAKAAGYVPCGVCKP
jgi:hypothetical protein